MNGKYVPDICEKTHRSHELSDLIFKTSGWSQYIKCRHCKKDVRAK